MFIGIILILASLIGVIICIGGIVGIWQVRANLSASLINTIGVLDTTVKATGDALIVAEDSLNQAGTSVDALAGTVRTTGETVKDTLPLFDSITKMTSEDLPKTIASTQTALTTAQSSATVIETTLTLLTSFPLLTSQPYNPEVPMGESLKDVSDSLDGIPASLQGMGDSLKTTSENISELEGQFTIMADNIQDITSTLGEAQAVIDQYQGVIGTLQDQLTIAKAGVPRASDMIAWVVTVILAWLGLTQIGLMMQGLEMIGVEVEADDLRKPREKQVVG